MGCEQRFRWGHSFSCSRGLSLISTVLENLPSPSGIRQLHWETWTLSLSSTTLMLKVVPRIPPRCKHGSAPSTTGPLRSCVVRLSNAEAACWQALTPIQNDGTPPNAANVNA